VEILRVPRDEVGRDLTTQRSDEVYSSDFRSSPDGPQNTDLREGCIVESRGSDEHLSALAEVPLISLSLGREWAQQSFALPWCRFP